MVTLGRPGKCSRTSIARLYASWPVDAAADHIARRRPPLAASTAGMIVSRRASNGWTSRKNDVSLVAIALDHHVAEVGIAGAEHVHEVADRFETRPAGHRAETSFDQVLLARVEGDRALVVDQLPDELEVGAGNRHSTAPRQACEQLGHDAVEREHRVGRDRQPRPRRACSPRPPSRHPARSPSLRRRGRPPTRAARRDPFP